MTSLRDPFAVVGETAKSHQVALNDMQTFEGISSTLDDIAGLMGSCKIYEMIHSSREFQSSKNVMQQLPCVYAAMLEFTAEAIYYSDKRYPGMPHIPPHVVAIFQSC